MRLRYLAAVGAVVAFPATALATSGSSLNLKLSPSAPHIDNTVQVSFSSPGIKAGYSFAVLIAGTSSCDGQEAAEKDVNGPRAKGKTIRVSFSPADNLVPGSSTSDDTTWCRGLAYASVTLDHHGKAAKQLGRLNFRFTAIP